MTARRSSLGPIRTGRRNRVTLAEALATVAGGESWALSLLAVMVLRTKVKALAPEIGFAATELARRLNAHAWTAVAIAALCYRPVHSLWLLGHAAPKLAAVLADLTAVTVAIGGFIALLAARGFARGLTLKRVRRGVAVNVAMVLAMTGAACLIR